MSVRASVGNNECMGGSNSGGGRMRNCSIQCVAVPLTPQHFKWLAVQHGDPRLPGWLSD